MSEITTRPISENLRKDLRIDERERILAAVSACVAEHGPLSYADLYLRVQAEEIGATPADVRGSITLLRDVGAVEVFGVYADGETLYEAVRHV